MKPNKKMINKAIILAAGFGIRLESITMHKPKCMVKVCGKPILEYQLDAYSKLGLNEIIVVTGYKSSIIEDFLYNRRQENIRIVKNENYKNSNNMYSLWLCKKELLECDRLYISNADVLFDDSILNRASNERESQIICQKNFYDEESMKIKIDSMENVNDISKTISQEESFGCSIDLYSFERDVLKKLNNAICETIEIKKDLNKWTEVAIQEIVNSGDVIVKPFCLEDHERWFEIDTLDNLIDAELVFSNLSKKLAQKKGFIFDLDGTIYIGEKPIDGAKELLNKLNKNNRIVKFLSNNSSKNKTEYIEKLKNQNINVTEENLIISTDVAIHELKSMGFKSGYILGTKSLVNNFEKNEIFHSPKRPEFVLIGYDTELDYEKLKQATLLINTGLPYFATHADIFCPTPTGPIPDAGSFIELFKSITGRMPVIFGKPKKSIIDFAVQNDDNLSNFVFVGDRLRTDFDMCKRANLDFICVLSGETQRELIENEHKWPELIVRSVNDLTELV